MRKNSARAVVYSNDNKDSFYLIYRRKNGKEYYTLPGGGIEDSESPLEAVKREVMEETGITLKDNIQELGSLEFDNIIFYIYEGIELEKGKFTGKEMQNTNPDNYYELQLHKVSDIPNLDLKSTMHKEFIINFIK